MEFLVGDTAYMKKPHPCGSHEWEILRVGMDFRIRCLGCGHVVMLTRAKFTKNIKKTVSKASEAPR
jgi:hypothetical protein